MTAIVRTFTFDTLDPYAQAQFWSQVLGTGMDPEEWSRRDALGQDAHGAVAASILAWMSGAS